ncbi:MAG: hypothetical protein ACI936_002792 [Paraglaciecola sp.]|jgi:hypothetical protein
MSQTDLSLEAELSESDSETYAMRTKVIMDSMALCAVRREVVCNAVHRDKSEPSVSPDDPKTLNKVASLTM